MKKNTKNLDIYKKQSHLNQGVSSGGKYSTLQIVHNYGHGNRKSDRYIGC